jgi:hypothetical protein
MRPFPWIGCLVALGLALRAWHFLRDPSVWHDEAALIVNVLGKSFGELLGPLLFAEAAPPLFLWVERATILGLGDSTYALRLVPFLASCASLVLLAWLAKRVLPESAAPWAVLLFAVSDRLLWHSCEAKPYTLDVFLAVGCAALLEATRHWSTVARIALCLPLAPLTVFLIYPGCFICGGLLVALLPEVWRDGRPRTWLTYAVLAGTIFVAFGLLLTGPIRAQRCELMTRCWDAQFPPLDRPWAVPLWVLRSTIDVVNYCCRPAGEALSILAAIGAVVLWRRGQRSLVTVLLVPIGLALVASFAGSYPYGGAPILVYAAPAFCLMIAAALPSTCAYLKSWGRPLPWIIAILLLIPLGNTLLRAAVPWRRADCDKASTYVLQHRRPNDTVRTNHWEYEYYFRHLAAPTTEPGGRLWVVITGIEPPEVHRGLADQMAGGHWHLTESRAYMFTSVYLFEPESAGSAARDQGSHVAALEATIDVDHDNVGRAAVEHGE